VTLVVPFDGSDLAEAALVRAAEFGAVLDEEVLAVSVIPRGNADYARKRGWIESDEAFDTDAVVSKLRDRVTDTCPDAEFRHELVDRYAPSGTISKRVRKVADEVDAAMVFLGSENAGRMVTSVSSVGGGIASDAGYDVVIVRHRRPSPIPELREHSPIR
jgi:nucleotide-binding universal stress UspA family protein